ncbi:MAG: hypothetical protein II016_07425 [Erysipelotrichaceae bacterium]|nr:hypothetical protein [Erysipelotrichaceae bacterium]
MNNEIFLKKAEELRPELIKESFTLDVIGKPMTEGEEYIFDFGNHYTGYITLDLSSAGHHPDAPLYLQLCFAEIREELDQDPEKYHGWISKGWIQEERIHIDVLPMVYKLERRYAFRYMKLKVLAASGNYSLLVNGITVDSVSSADYQKVTYPDFEAKDRRLDEVSLRTLHSCMQEVFEDGPKRDRRLWLGDLRLEALVNYRTFRNNDLVKRCLYLFAGSTLDNGMLASNVFIEPKVECDYQAMFDYTLFFICTLWDYYEETGDLQILRDLEETCLTQYRLLKECFDEKDLLDTSRTGRIFIDWNFELDKQASGQAVYIYALKDLVRIEKALGKDGSEIEEEIARKTAAALTMFDRKKGLFVSGIDRQISWASQIWMILAGVLDEEENRKVLERIASVEDAVPLNSPYAYHHYIQALIDAGGKDEAYEKMHEYWGGMIEKGADTFWEIYNPKDPYVSPYGGLVVHSFCHAWSCTPAYFLRKYYYSK